MSEIDDVKSTELIEELVNSYRNTKVELSKIKDVTKRNMKWDDRFDRFWEFFAEKTADFDEEALKFKARSRRIQKASIILMVTVPEMISLIGLLNITDPFWKSMLNLYIPVIATFLVAFSISLVNIRKYENLFMTSRATFEKLKRQAYLFEFSAEPSNEKKQKEFVQNVIQILQIAQSEFEGIFTQ